MLHLFLAFAIASEAVEDPEPMVELEAVEETALLEEPVAAEPEPATTAQVMSDAIRRIRLADYMGARLLLDEAVSREDVDLEEVTYLRGVSWELDRDYTTALGLYNEGLGSFPEGARAEDFAFRRAEVIGGLGRPEDALDLLTPFTRDLDERPQADQIKIRLVEATWLAEAGKRRKALKRIASTLEDADPSDVPFYQAKARAAVCRLWAEDADQLDLDVAERKQVKRLTSRGATLVAIEKQVTTIALMEEPEWVLDGLLTLGDSYAAVGLDLIAVEPPKKLAPEVHTLYRQAVAQKSEVVLIKALNHYQSGIDLALRLGWQSRRVGELETARDALAVTIEGLPLP
ncbi:MAG: hypothetical protein KC912_10405 [Proteobacteria bacterium]|nr:hypothetical protein [Pseudomonadota bacterium]